MIVQAPVPPESERIQMEVIFIFFAITQLSKKFTSILTKTTILILRNLFSKRFFMTLLSQSKLGEVDLLCEVLFNDQISCC